MKNDHQNRNVEKCLRKKGQWNSHISKHEGEQGDAVLSLGVGSHPNGHHDDVTEQDWDAGDQQIPDEVGEPVDDRVHSGHELQMFDLVGSLVHQMHEETGGQRAEASEN